MEGSAAHYVEKDAVYVIGRIMDILERWSCFLKRYERTPYTECMIDECTLAEVVRKVDRRKAYYSYFHDIGEGRVSEYKEAALQCYWIAKLKPFQMPFPESDLHDFANEAFGIHIIFSEIVRVFHNRAQKYILPPADYLQALRYSLRYRHITEDALVDIVDGLAVAMSCTTRGE